MNGLLMNENKEKSGFISHFMTIGIL